MKTTSKAYVCKDRLENIIYEQSLENKRKQLDKEISDLKSNKQLYLNEIEAITREINDISIEIEVLENYDRYYNPDGKKRKRAESQESTPNLLKKKSKKSDIEMFKSYKLKMKVFKRITQ